MVAACLFAAMAGPGMAAQEPNPEPLWKAYPLDNDQGSSAGSVPNVSTTTTPAASPAATTTQAPVTVADEAGDGPPWALMIAAAGGGALFVVLLLTLQGRRARRRGEGPLVGAAEEWPWLTAKASRDAHEFRVERLRDAPGMPTTNGVAPERAEESVSQRAAETREDAEPERAAEPASNGAAAEWVAERPDDRVPEWADDRVPERAAESASNGAAAEWVAERADDGVAEGTAERADDGVAEGTAERADDPEREWEADPAATGAAAERVDERTEPASNGAVAEPASPPSDPAFDVVEADAVPRQRFDREPEVSNGRPAPARHGPICQVRWSSPGTCFYAATTDADGVEHRLAWSPPIEWRESGPPDEDSREARAALRVLSKELRDKGWRPMRAKGDDFDEPRWYARRFRFPVVEGDDDVAPWQHGPPTAAARAHGES